jgi:hypothetical protein
VKYFRADENRGTAWNHRRVFELSCGEYFKWAAHDDVHMPDFLERAVNILDSDSEIDWCFGRFQFIDANGDLLLHEGMADGSVLELDGPGRLSPKAHTRFRAVLIGSTNALDVYGLHRRDNLAETAISEPYYGYDKVLVAELAMRGRYFEFPEVGFLRRVHAAASGSITSAVEQRQFMNPKSSTRFAFHRLRIVKGHLDAIRRTRLTLRDTVGCYLAISRYFFQFSKWPRVVRSMLSGEGAGGGFLDKLGSERFRRQQESGNAAHGDWEAHARREIIEQVSNR